MRNLLLKINLVSFFSYFYYKVGASVTGKILIKCIKQKQIYIYVCKKIMYAQFHQNSNIFLFIFHIINYIYISL